MTQQPDLNALRKEAFSALRLPPMWKLEVEETCRLNENPESEVSSLGWQYLDTRTSGKDIKRYRVFYHLPTGKYGLVEKYLIDFGETKKQCLCSNMSAAVFNDFLKTKFA